MTMRVLAAFAATSLCVLGAGAKTFGDDDGGFVYRGARIGNTPETATVIASGKTLADYKVAYSYFKAVDDPRVVMVNGVAHPYCEHVETIDGVETVVVEFQRFNHRESRIYCAEACFFQDGPDVKAYLRRGFYTDPYAWRLGQSFAKLMDEDHDPAILSSNLASDSQNGYGLTHFVFTRKEPVVVRPANDSEIASDFTVLRGTDLVIDKYAYETNKTFQTAAKTVDGVMTLRNFAGNRELTGAVNGSEGGEICIENSAPEGGVVNYTGPAAKKGCVNNGDIVATDAPLWAITNITAINGGSVMGGKRMNMQMFFWNNYFDRATFQLHAMGTYSGKNCLYAGRFTLTRLDGDQIQFGVMNKIRFVYTDNAAAIELSKGEGVAPGTINPFSLAAGNFTECNWPADNPAGGGCNLTNLTFYLKDVSSTQVFSGKNLIPTGGVLRVRGKGGAKSVLQANALSALPTNGTVFVEAGGKLLLNASGNASGHGFAGDTTEIFVSTNGELETGAVNYPFGCGRTVDSEAQRVYLDGGKLTSSSTVMNNKPVSRFYLGRLTLANGAYATGPQPWRIGGDADASKPPSTNFVWLVTGASPSTFDAGWTLNGYTNVEKKSTFPLGMYLGDHFIVNVDDVTGNADPDFIVGGNTFPDREAAYGGSNPCTPVIKRGAGTMSFTGTFRSDNDLRIEKGLVHLAANVMTSSADTPTPIVLAGGGLSAGADTVNAAGTLKLLGKAGVTNQLVVAEGAKISFADSSAVAWDPGVRLMITGTVGPQTIRFGTDANGLTPQQQRQIRINCDRGRGHLDANGYLVDDGILGSVLIIR